MYFHVPQTRYDNETFYGYTRIVIEAEQLFTKQTMLINQKQQNELNYTPAKTLSRAHYCVRT